MHTFRCLYEGTFCLVRKFLAVSLSNISQKRDLASRLQQTANVILYRVFSPRSLYCSLLLLPQNKWLHISYVFNNCFGLFSIAAFFLF